MLVVRTARAADLDALLLLARAAGPGMTTLKADRAALAARLAVAEASFRAAIPHAERDYVFVLEDLARGRVAGIAAIKGAVGLDEPFYNYRIEARDHAAPDVGVTVRHDVLHLSHELAGCAELCSLFLHPDYRKDGNRKLLSKSGFLFIAQFPHLFGRSIFAEMRGYQALDGSSPFWESLGRKFFDMDFQRADDLCQPGGKGYIAALMPRYPVYTRFLSDAARAAIGVTHVNTAPARRLLEQEGMRASAWIDIFDGGPVLHAQLNELRAVRDSVLVAATDGERCGIEATRQSLVCNDALANFRVIASAAAAQQGTIRLSSAERLALGWNTVCTMHVLPIA